MSTIALLTAAGVGSRMHQDIPKQFLNVDNKPILIYTLEAFQKHPSIDEICVVILKGWENILEAYASQFNISKLKYIVQGGTTGQESIYNGLREIKKYREDDDIVMIHDGNRPMVSQEMITNSLITYQQYGDAVAAIPCTEVVFVVDQPESQKSSTSIERNNLRRTQTPHTYKLGDILQLQKKRMNWDILIWPHVQYSWRNLERLPIFLLVLKKILKSQRLRILKYLRRCYILRMMSGLSKLER